MASKQQQWRQNNNNRLLRTIKCQDQRKNFDTKENELILDLFAENNELLMSKHTSVETTQNKNSVLRETRRYGSADKDKAVEYGLRR